MGQCCDNAVIECTFGRLEMGLVHGEQYTARDEATASLIEYLTPVEFERTHYPNNR